MMQQGRIFVKKCAESKEGHVFKFGKFKEGEGVNAAIVICKKCDLNIDVDGRSNGLEVNPWGPSPQGFLLQVAYQKYQHYYPSC